MLTPKQIAAINRLRSKCKWPLGRIERHLQISRKAIKQYLLSALVQTGLSNEVGWALPN
jgi:hypothetical protein